MGTTHQKGFTVIEVTLFLAITGLLFLVALIGTGSTIRAVRFTDSGRSLEAFMQRQYDDIVNGLNTRAGEERCSISGSDLIVTPGSNQTPGTSNCLLIGKLIVFQQNSSTLRIFNVVGAEPADVDYSESDTELIPAFNPQLVTETGPEEYDIPWQAFVLGTKRLSDNQAVTGLLLIRSPKSTRIVNYTYKVGDPVAKDLSSVVNTTANIARTTNFCIMNADNFGLPAKLEVNDASNQQAVRIIFDINAGSDCNGV